MRLDRSSLPAAVLVLPLCAASPAQTTERVSVDSAAAQANGQSRAPVLSADGRFAAFVSPAPDLVAGDTNGFWDVFVRDRQLGTTERVSVDSGGAQGNGESGFYSHAYPIPPAISADGRYVVFESAATNLVAADSNGVIDVFVHDRQSGVTERISVDSMSTEGNF